MKKIIDYKEKDLNLQLVYAPGKEALDRKYNLKIIKDNKEFVKICITDNNSGCTIKNTHKALQALDNQKHYIFYMLQGQGIRPNYGEFTKELVIKSKEYNNKYQELKEKNMKKGIYYFN